MQKKQYGNQDQKEKSRELSQNEKKRLDLFEKKADEMVSQGYKRVELTVSIVKANVFAIILLIPVMGIGLWLFILKNGPSGLQFTPKVMLIWIVLILVLTVVHELVHGLSWSLFTPNHFKDVEFGFMKQYLTPYCACTVPLSKGQYIFGALMPLVLVGLVPMVIGILSGSAVILWTGIVMTVSAAGDIMIVWNVLRYKTDAEEIVYMDHPTQAGGVIFEKQA